MDVDVPTNDNHAFEEEENDDEDTEPVFIDADDDVEEVVVDDTPPAPDSDDDAEMATDPSLPPPPPMSIEPDSSLATLRSHRGPVYSVCCVPAGGGPSPSSSSSSSSPPRFYVATGSGDDSAHVTTLDLTTSPPSSSSFQLLPGHAESVSAASFSVDRTLLATADYGGLISIWCADPAPASASSPLKLDRTLPSGPTDVEWLTWHPKGNVFAVGSTDGTAWMYLAKTGAVMQVFAGHDPSPDEDSGGGVTAGKFTPDGRHLITVGGSPSDSTLRVWNPKTGQARHVFKSDAKGGVFFPLGGLNALAVGGGPDGLLAAAGSSSGQVAVVHVDNKKVLGRGLQHALTTATTTSSSSSSSASGDADETALDNETSIEAVAFCPTNANVLASGGSDGRVCVWEVGAPSGSGTAALRSTLSHPAGVTTLLWKEGSDSAGVFRGIYTACSDGVVRMWDSRTGACVREMHGHQDMVLCLDVVRAEGYGDIVLSGGDDHCVKVWGVPDSDVEEIAKTVGR